VALSKHKTHSDLWMLKAVLNQNQVAIRTRLPNMTSPSRHPKFTLTSRQRPYFEEDGSGTTTEWPVASTIPLHANRRLTCFDG
jgi:hypothetical protein